MARVQDSASLLPTISGRPYLFVIVAALASLVPGAYARRWEDVIAASIYAQSHVDLPRLQLAIEESPQNVAPTTTLLSESHPPSDAPSSVPSFYNQEAANEEESAQDPLKPECPQGEAAFRLKMYDSWGDGWGETMISIHEVGKLEGAPMVELSQDVASQDFAPTTRNNNIQKRSSGVRSNWQHRGLEDYILIGGLKKGVFDSKLFCLSIGACYAAVLEGGKWQEEAGWEITPADAEVGTSVASQNTIAKGSGLSNCTFYVAEDAMDKPTCPFTCRPPPAESKPEREEVDEQAEAEGEADEVEAEGIIVQGIVDTNRNQGEDDATEIGNALQTGNPLRQTSEPSQALLREPSSAPSDAPSLVPTL